LSPRLEPDDAKGPFRGVLYFDGSKFRVSENDGAFTDLLGGLADGAVTTNKLGSGAVTTTKLGVDAVTSASLLAGAVTTSKLHSEALLPITLDRANSRVGVGITSPGKTLDVTGDIRSSATAFYGTGGSYQTTNAGSHTVGAATVGSLTLKASKGINFADGSTMYGAPRVSRVYDPRSGCPPPNEGDNVALWNHPFTCSKSCTVFAHVQMLHNAGGTHYYYVAIGGTVYGYGAATNVATAQVTFSTNLTAGSYTLSPKNYAGHGGTFGCGAGWGWSEVVIFEKQ
jgi:hypothetical protein